MRQQLRATLLGRLGLVLVFAALLGVGAAGAHPKAARAAAPGTGAPTPVYRYWSASAADWVSIPAGGNQPGADVTKAEGYTQDTTAQFYVDLIGNDQMVADYRWWQPADKDWIDVTDGSIPDATMIADGYVDKTFQWYAYAAQRPNTVAVYRWWQPTDRDWVTLRDGEIPDATLMADGYQQKTLLFYAYPQQSPDGSLGYFELGPVQSSVLAPPAWAASGDTPHTFSVLDVNPTNDSTINQGYRYIGYFGHVNCSGIGIARSNDLDTWVEDPNALFNKNGERWASALSDGKVIDMVYNTNYCAGVYPIVGAYSTDGLNGAQFTTPVTLVQESDTNGSNGASTLYPNVADGNPTLFDDAVTKRIYLYWWRQDGTTYQIRAKSADTFADLLKTSPSDLGQAVAFSQMRFAAPQLMYVKGTYYLAVETFENGNTWKTRVLTSSSPTGPFFEIPGNPVYFDGSACVFQHVFGDTLHSFYCQQATPNGSWSLNHVTADLTSPT